MSCQVRWAHRSRSSNAPLQSICWARKARAKPKFTNVRYAVQNCAKRTSTNKATYLSLKSDFVKGVWAESWSFACLVILERERSKFQRVLRDFAVWRSAETRAWSRSRFESLRWVCEWLWDPRGEGDILTTCIFAIFHLVLLFVVKKASWYGKLNPLLDLPCRYLM